MFSLNDLTKIVKKRKRVGRGGGRGGHSGRGKDGQLKRPGGRHEISPKFEGGQMSLLRRLPRRGFTNFTKVEYRIVSLEQIQNNFSSGETVSYESLRNKNLIKGLSNKPVKLLSSKNVSSISFPVHITIDAWSKSVESAVVAAGGSITASV